MLLLIIVYPLLSELSRLECEKFIMTVRYLSREGFSDKKIKTVFFFCLRLGVCRYSSCSGATDFGDANANALHTQERHKKGRFTVPERKGREVYPQRSLRVFDEILKTARLRALRRAYIPPYVRENACERGLPLDNACAVSHS